MAWLPTFNAACNAVATALLVLGWLAIRRGERERHGTLMRAAFGVSVLFLAGYLTHKATAGDTPYAGEGLDRTLYLVLLASHVILAMVNLPMVLVTLWLAHKEDWERHKRWARRTFPIWLYVSVTGVVVYLILYVLGMGEGV